MIEQEKVSTIVMLCMVQKGFTGCSQYFPPGVDDDSSSEDLENITGKHPILSSIETIVDVMFIIDIVILRARTPSSLDNIDCLLDSGKHWVRLFEVLDFSNEHICLR